MRNHVHLAAVPRFFRTLASELLFILVILCSRRGAVLAADLRYAEHGLPTLIDGRGALRGGKSEAGGSEGSFGPAIVDAGDMPVHRVRGGVAVQLVADVDEVLDGCDVDIVDGGEVEDDGFESGFIGFDGEGFATARARVVPRAILGCGSVNATCGV